MKKLTKTLLLVLCAILLVAGSVLGTVAYLTDRQDVTNTFTVGNVQIKLDEAVVDAETGKAYDLKVRTEEGNPDVLLVPGRTIDKDPTVTVLKDSEDCYVRVKVTVDLPNWTPDAAKLAGWMTDKQNFADAFSEWAKNFDEQYLSHIVHDTTEHGFNPVDWKLSWTELDPNAKTITYVLTYKTSDKSNIVRKNIDDNTVLNPVFDKVVAPTNLTNAQLALLEGMEIKVEAHAIQAEGFTETRTEDATVPAEQNAWMAFDG